MELIEISLNSTCMQYSCPYLTLTSLSLNLSLATRSGNFGFIDTFPCLHTFPLPSYLPLACIPSPCLHSFPFLYYLPVHCIASHCLHTFPLPTYLPLVYIPSLCFHTFPCLQVPSFAFMYLPLTSCTFPWLHTFLWLHVPSLAFMYLPLPSNLPLLNLPYPRLLNFLPYFSNQVVQYSTLYRSIHQYNNLCIPPSNIHPSPTCLTSVIFQKLKTGLKPCNPILRPSSFSYNILHSLYNTIQCIYLIQ